MHKQLDVLSFISINDDGDHVEFYFTSAALDILRSRSVVMPEEIAKAIVGGKLCNSLKVQNLQSAKYIEKRINEAEYQVLSEQYISSVFPRLKIKSGSPSYYKDHVELSITADHCGKKCEGCVRRACLKLAKA